MAGPINPEEVQTFKDAKIPEEVFRIFNDLIVENWDGTSATVTQEIAEGRIAEVLGITRQEVYNRHLLSVEGIYRKAGWKVLYDTPGYNEEYNTYFRFSK